eukprot:gb/GEZJ01003724.1/.p1 GENE.gb/GEZJ01003724.1/~~gb/GEZJ01003724.1/.p1  ORF type:complete len:665 (-),score=96.24 gb/GEZJ01003724.1/:72-2066(-)
MKNHTFNMGTSSGDDLNAFHFINLESNEGLSPLPKLQATDGKDACDLEACELEAAHLAKLGTSGGSSSCTPESGTLDMHLGCEEPDTTAVLPAVNLEEFARGTEQQDVLVSQQHDAMECNATMLCMEEFLSGSVMALGNGATMGSGEEGCDALVGDASMMLRDGLLGTCAVDEGAYGGGAEHGDLGKLLLDAPVTDGGSGSGSGSNSNNNNNRSDTRKGAVGTEQAQGGDASGYNGDVETAGRVLNPDMKEVSQLLSYMYSQRAASESDSRAVMNMMACGVSANELEKWGVHFDVHELMRSYGVALADDAAAQRFTQLLRRGWAFTSGDAHTSAGAHVDADAGAAAATTTTTTTVSVQMGLETTVDGCDASGLLGGCGDDLLNGDALLMVQRLDDGHVGTDGDNMVQLLDVSDSNARLDALVRAAHDEGGSNDGGGNTSSWNEAPAWALGVDDDTAPPPPPAAAAAAATTTTAAMGRKTGRTRGGKRKGSGSKRGGAHAEEAAGELSDEELLRARPKKKRRAAKFDKPVPSRFCHVCSRTPKNVRLATCARIRAGTCRKVVCEKCFERYGYGAFGAALGDDARWLCPHCRGDCPQRAQCRTYQRINDRLRVTRLRQERAAAAAVATATAATAATAAADVSTCPPHKRPRLAPPPHHPSPSPPPV